jgi:hypothetical protein
VGLVTLKRSRWKEMTDSDMSHSSEKRLDTYTKGVGLDFFIFIFIFIFLKLHFFCFHFFYICFVLDIYFLTSGASSPEWVKPTAEGGGLFLLVVFCCILLF